MESRLSRHKYDDEVDVNYSRQRKNENLYKQDYTDDEIKVPKISNGREINEEEFQKLINLSQTRSMKKITKEDIEKFESSNEDKFDDFKKKEDKVYDINTVLESAKNRRKVADESKYNVPKFDDYKPIEEESDNSDLLSDLMGNDNTIVTKAISNDTIVNDETVTSTRIDNSFYSKSLKFKKKDFDLEDDGDDEFVQKKKPKSQVIITVIIVILLIAAIVLGVLVLSKIKF